MMNQPRVSHSEIERYLEHARRERAKTIARFLRVGIARTASAFRRAAARVAQRSAPPQGSLTKDENDVRATMDDKPKRGRRSRCHHGADPGRRRQSAHMMRPPVPWCAMCCVPPQAIWPCSSTRSDGSLGYAYL
jgi:hypothetical protein